MMTELDWNARLISVEKVTFSVCKFMIGWSLQKSSKQVLVFVDQKMLPKSCLKRYIYVCE